MGTCRTYVARLGCSKLKMPAMARLVLAVRDDGVARNGKRNGG
jgi:hypothetical protein